jgi:hypothetical protein
MATQRILLKHPSGKTAEIKMGFSWPACLLGPLWALVKRLWLHLFILIAAIIPLNVLSDYAEHIKSLPLNLISLLLFIAYMYICGRFASSWLHAGLLKRGYLPVISQEPNA